MLTKEKMEAMTKWTKQKHLENKEAIAQGKKPPHMAVYNLSKVKNLDSL